MEAIFSSPGLSHISDKIVKCLAIDNMSNLSKTSKTLAVSTARFWFQKFIKKFKLEPQLEEFYTNLMSYSNPDIQQCLGYVMRIRVERGIELKIQPYNWLCQTNCPLALSIIFNQLRLVELILNHFSNEVEDFLLAIKLAIVGDFSLDFLESLLLQWAKMNCSKNKNNLVKFAPNHGKGDVSKLEKLVAHGMFPASEIEFNDQNNSYAAMDLAVKYDHIGIVKMLIPFYLKLQENNLISYMFSELEKSLALAISNGNIEMIEILYHHCRDPSSQVMNLRFDESLRRLKLTWTFYAAINGMEKSLQKLIDLEKKNPLPSNLEDQCSYLSGIFRIGKFNSNRWVQFLHVTSEFPLTFVFTG